MVIQKIVDQHAEEASMLWLRRTLAVGQPQFALRDLARLDNRLEAHLDGLRVAGDDGWEVCREALESAGPGEVFTAAVLAFEVSISNRLAEVVTLGGSSPTCSRSLGSALGWLRAQAAQPHIRALLESDNPLLHLAGIAGSAIQRLRPETLAQDIEHINPLVRARVCRAAGELGALDLRYALVDHLKDAHEECRFWAAWSAARLGHAEAWAHLSAIASSPSRASGCAATMLMRVVDPPSALALQQQLAKTRTGILAAGALGDPTLVPYLLEQMTNLEVARVAGEAFSMITGLDLIFEKLGTPRLKRIETGPTENPQDEDVAMDPDENLPWPDPELIAKWWTQHRVEFQGGNRHLLGKRISIAWCQQVLRIGHQRQRAAAALELAIRQPGQPLFNVAAPGYRQQQMLRGDQ